MILFLTAQNMRVSGSDFQPLPKSPSVTSDTCQPLDDILFNKLENCTI